MRVVFSGCGFESAGTAAAGAGGGAGFEEVTGFAGGLGEEGLCAWNRRRGLVVVVVVGGEDFGLHFRGQGGEDFRVEL